jgi:two-component system sensor histidine kinase TctE
LGLAIIKEIADLHKAQFLLNLISAAGGIQADLIFKAL